MIFISSGDTIVLTSNAKTAPDQTYNDTTAMHIGREFDLEKASPPVDRLSSANPEGMPPPFSVTLTLSLTNTGTSTSGHTDSTSGSTNGNNGSNGRTNVGAIVGGTSRNPDFE